jgi:hypothetical protein
MYNDLTMDITPSVRMKSKMRFIWYATHTNNNSYLDQIVKTFEQDSDVERYTTVECLAKRLLQKLESKTIAVVYVASEQDLIDLYFIQHLLRKVVLVLLISDTERHTIAMGHRLHPFFMCNADIQTSDLTIILNNIAHHGYPPKHAAPFDNPFESLQPHCLPRVQRDSWIFAAA